MRPNWSEYFLAIAKVVSTRSEDPKTKVGAVLVKDHRIVSTGYNGAAAGYDYTDWHSDAKHQTVLHAELNCLIYANRNDTEGSTLYVTHSPCAECAKIIAAAKIREVIYDTLYKDGAGLPLLVSMGVRVRRCD